jgi:hypothetical protein
MCKEYLSGRRLQGCSLFELGESSMSEVFLRPGDSVFPPLKAAILAIIATATK